MDRLRNKNIAYKNNVKKKERERHTDVKKTVHADQQREKIEMEIGKGFYWVRHYRVKLDGKNDSTFFWLDAPPA